MILTDTTGQTNLPRYFARCFGVARQISAGRLDIALPDGRVFRAEGTQPGPVARLDIHDPEVFARLVREGYLGFWRPISMATGQRRIFRPSWIC